MERERQAGGIRLDGVSKIYAGGVRAVDDVSIEIGDGEFIVLVGPSGCGKSTLLRMIAGLEEVTAGTIAIGGEDVTARKPSARDIAMVFQSYALYPHMTVAGNLAFGLRQRKAPKEEIERRVAAAARMLGLEELLTRRPAALSGGQRQRVAMGRALVREPRAFLLDEPLSNLDAKLRTSMRSQLARLHERVGTTTVYVTHDQVEAMTLGERVAIMRDGVVQQCDTPTRLFHTPANLFVAAFIGSPAMNLVEATLQDGLLRFGDVALPLPAGAGAPPLADGARVVLGVRPSDFELAAPGTDPAWPRIDVAAEVVEELGSETHVTFALDAPRVATDDVRAAEDVAGEDEAQLLADDLRVRFVARVHGRGRIDVGARLQLAVDHTAFHLFDPATGVALTDRRKDSVMTASAPTTPRGAAA
ncbi:ABC transporter ATP-binding protein [Conexibacter woesei]|uniref:ABC transporter related protein n=1 Tax=Conexibacter woesei (strain DSM 14684 / CCUG 47730 / CIP 108061 / JCM 11494 / NBRC 100937 / ID131577) TaxID=469383 RepID=D3F3K6_CONWI|nr:sn-glycerol-3-phosphate ABC transporter ATP-binding protein UgpC [Conexibacter woesei]ADB52371.1 ABC transporter related protein [Conexibacter woesei DSM 14684]